MGRLRKCNCGSCKLCKNRAYNLLARANRRAGSSTPTVVDEAKYTRRICLRCGYTFPSDGIGNRLCVACKTANDMFFGTDRKIKVWSAR